MGTFADPYSVTVNPKCSGACSIFVADPGANTVYEVTANLAKRMLIAPASVGSTFDPVGVGVNVKDEVFIADKGGRYSAIEITGSGGGIGMLTGALIDHPLYYRGVAAYHLRTTAGTEWAVYAAAATHFPLTSQGKLECVRGTACAFQSHTFSDPYGVAVDLKNQVFVVDARDKKAYRVTAHGAHDLGKTFVDPYGIAVTPDGQWIYVADAGAKKVYQRDPYGTWSEVGTFADPYGVAVGPDRTLYVADPGSKNVWKVTQ